MCCIFLIINIHRQDYMKNLFYKIGLVVFSICIYTFLAVQPVTAFSDTRDHWARAHIDLLQSRQLVSGYPDGMYRPGASVTRQELVSMIIRILGKSEDAIELQKGDASYKDTSNVWGKGYIELAHELSIVHGDEQKRFHPEVPVTREEAVMMLVNCLDAAEKNEFIQDFTDEKEISNWARNHVAAALELGLINGFPDGSFRPQQNITRAEAAVMLENFLGVTGQKFHFFGQLSEIELSAKKAIVLINGKEQVFTLSETIAAYQQGSNQPISELKLPVKAYINVNSQGQLAYLYLVDQMPANKISLSLTSLPEAEPAKVQTPGSLVPLEEDLAVNTKYSDADLGRSLYNTKEAMKVNEFIEEYGITGHGQLVAVIDSGIDPGHADLQTTSEGYPKIIDFIDLTDQGRVLLKEAVKQEGNYIVVDGRKIDVSNIPNNAKSYRYGYFKIPSLGVEFSDIKQSDSVLVLAAASKYNENFDTIYIDTDRNYILKDEIAIKKYSQLQQFASIKGLADRKLNLVLSEISSEGKYIKLAFDNLGHGTQVAGIVAANGKIQGVAPGAQILAIKVLNSMGVASLNNLEKAVRIAAERDSKVAVISMGQYSLSSSDRKRMSAFAQEMLTKHGLIICIAAGNQGPGIETVASTASIKNVISTGAYATPAMWRNDYGWSVASPTLWYFSSAGPANNGSMAPSVIAPGSVLSAYPLWGEQNYRLSEGTSIAAPHVAGVAALLASALSQELYRYDTQSIYSAILEGADRISSFTAAEQGFGAVNILKSWDNLQEGEKEIIAYETKQYSPDQGYTESLYSRFLQPAELGLTVYNNSDKNYKMAAGGLSSWIRPEQYTIQLPSNGYRNIQITYDQLTDTGLYSDLVVLDDINTPGYDISVLQTLVVPVQLQKAENYRYSVEDKLAAGQMQRYYFYVPSGASKLSFDLNVGDNGRARLHVVSPGQYVETSSYAGTGEVQIQDSTRLEYEQPEAGTWEVVVYSSASLSDYNLKETAYELAAAMEGWEKPAIKTPEEKYLVTAITEKIKKGEESIVTLHFWDPVTKKPADGVVAIEERLYEIQNGMVQLPVTAASDQIHLTIAW